MRDQATSACQDARLWPRVQRCVGCGDDVVLAKWPSGHVVMLDPMPVIVGSRPCQWCRGKGERMVREYAKGGPGPVAEPGDLAGRMTKGTMTSCPSCDGTAVRGVTLTRKHVVMAIDGTLRHELVLVAPWDSAYTRHLCPRRGSGDAQGRSQGRANGELRC